MSYSFNIRYFVYGRDIYADITPDPDSALGYFSRSSILEVDPDYPTGEFRLAVQELTEEQQAPQFGRDFAVVNVDIDFTQR